MRRACSWLAVALALAAGAQQSSAPPTEAQQRPVFRGGTHFVRVDAYPLKDGKIVEDLRAADFEVFEDGTPQAIDSFDFVKFETFTPTVERRDPRSQREGFDLAADPRYRVFVLVVNPGSRGIYTIQKPLVHFLNRVLGRNDLFGLLSIHQSAHDLVLGQSTITAEAEIEKLWHSSLMDRQPADQLDACGNGGAAVKGLFVLDEMYTNLESLLAQLGSLRQERKNIIFVSNGLPAPRPSPAIRESFPGKVPPIGVVGGRISIGGSNGPEANTNYCASEIQRLASIDFLDRYSDLLKEAKRQNVTFYAITPAGLQAPLANAARSGGLPNPALEMARINANNDGLRSLAEETDGIAIVDTNDLEGGMRRIADDLAAYYVLGYYTTNTKWDGGLRRIKVRLKSTGKEIRARREYRAPTAEEIAALSAPPRPPRSATREETLPAAPTPSLIGDATLRHNGSPVAALVCTRADRIAVEWPLLGPVDSTRVRLLDRRGQPLPFPVAAATDEPRPPHRVVSELRLAPLARGEYALELTVTQGTSSDRKTVNLKIE